jgi:hypothetical protein
MSGSFLTAGKKLLAGSVAKRSAPLAVRAAGLIEIVLGSYAAFIAGICVFRLIPANETWSLDLRRAGSRVHAADDLKWSVYARKHLSKRRKSFANSLRAS